MSGRPGTGAPEAKYITKEELPCRKNERTAQAFDINVCGFCLMTKGRTTKAHQPTCNCGVALCWAHKNMRNRSGLVTCGVCWFQLLSPGALKIMPSTLLKAKRNPLELPEDGDTGDDHAMWTAGETQRAKVHTCCTYYQTNVHTHINYPRMPKQMQRTATMMWKRRWLTTRVMERYTHAY